jgi:hypothetical protein
MLSGQAHALAYFGFFFSFNFNLVSFKLIYLKYITCVILLNLDFSIIADEQKLVNQATSRLPQ